MVTIRADGPIVTAPDGTAFRQYSKDQIAQIALIRAEPIANRYSIDFRDADNVKSHLEGWAEKFASDPANEKPADKAATNEFIAKLHDPGVKGDALVAATTDFLKGIEANHGGGPPVGMLLHDRMGPLLDNISLATQAYGAANNLQGGDVLLYHDFQMRSDTIPRIRLPGGASLAETAPSAANPLVPAPAPAAPEPAKP